MRKIEKNDDLPGQQILPIVAPFMEQGREAVKAIREPKWLVSAIDGLCHGRTFLYHDKADAETHYRNLSAERCLRVVLAKIERSKT